ncbi:MAG: HpcH/HpaI aldolase/citrate lyase family protein [Acidobacteriaceae bacterium]
MRSKLFVPGNRPELFLKALASEADAICLDLEDAVARDRKLDARKHVREFLSSNVKTDKKLMVRVNAVRSPDFADDLAAATCSRIAMLVLPKVEDPSEVVDAASALLTIEKERNLQGPIKILATIESARGLRLAEAIGKADPRVVGLQLGLADLFEPLGINRGDKIATHQVRLQLRFAAGEAEIACFDGAFPHFADAEGFTVEAVAARSLGFAGKSCIHPGQIAIANRVFSPTPEEIAFSLRIVEAARAGAGAFALDGRMIDEPYVRRAENIIRFANGTDCRTE